MSSEIVPPLVTHPPQRRRGARRLEIEARKHAASMLAKITDAAKAGKLKKVEVLARRYLISFDARFVAAIDARKTLKSDRRPKKALLQSVARGLSAWEGTDEEVYLYVKHKTSDPYFLRPLTNPGLKNRTLQHLVRAVLGAVADLHPNQFLMKGVHAAMERVVSALEAGHTHAQEIDIASCYQSFDGEKTAALLPLPKEVTRRVLLCAYLTYSTQYFTDVFGSGESGLIACATALQDARRGIPQGSAASPILVELLLAPVFRQLPDGGVVTGYSDNTLILGQTKSDVASISKALRSALVAHPAGCLKPKLKKFEPGGPVDFLGHRLTLRKGTVLIEPKPENRKEFRTRLRNGLRVIKNPNVSARARKREAGELRRFVVSWAAAFKLCHRIDKVRDDALARIAGAIKSPSLTPAPTSTPSSLP